MIERLPIYQNPPDDPTPFKYYQYANNLANVVLRLNDQLQRGWPHVSDDEKLSLKADAQTLANILTGF